MTGETRVLHLSDLHATASGPLYGAVAPLERLERVADYVRENALAPDLVLVTGDLAQRGNPDAYPLVAEALARLARRVGAPVHTVLGNHDDVAAARVLPGHAHGHTRREIAAGFRVILLDSHTGALGPEQLAWLRAELAEPSADAPLGTLVALHHAPVGSPMPVLAHQGLADADAFLDALAGTDTRAILAGHFHHALTGAVRDIPLFVAPALAYHQVMDAGPDVVAGHDTPLCALLRIGRDSVTSTIIELAAHEPLFTQPAVTPIQKATHVS